MIKAPKRQACPCCGDLLVPRQNSAPCCCVCGYVAEPEPIPVSGSNPFPPGHRGRSLWDTWARDGGIGPEPTPETIDPGDRARERYASKTYPWRPRRNRYRNQPLPDEDRDPVRIPLEYHERRQGRRDWDGLGD